jgi:glycosyltransferase involved in cell wall biosynthesis
VVIPVCGRMKYLSECFNSVWKQSRGPAHMEILIVNSGEFLLGDYCFPATVKHFQDDLGAIRNWNRAIGLTRGRWIHLLHDDDYVLPGFYAALERMSPSAGVASTGYENEDGNFTITFSKRIAPERGVLDRPAWLNRIGVANHLNPPAVVVARSTYEHIGLYHPDLGYCPDWELYKRAACFFDWWNEPGLLARYRQHDQSGTLTADLIQKYRAARQAIALSERYYPAKIAAEVASQSRHFWYELALVDSLNRARNGDHGVAAGILREAAQLLEG